VDSVQAPAMLICICIVQYVTVSCTLGAGTWYKYTMPHVIREVTDMYVLGATMQNMTITDKIKEVETEIQLLEIRINELKRKIAMKKDELYSLREVHDFGLKKP